MLLQLVVALLTAPVGWLTWYAYGVYKKGQLLSGMPGPPRRPGLVNFVLGHIPDLAGSQNHFVQKQWSRQYGGIMKLRALDTYIAVVADPLIASELLRDKTLDKSRHAYQMLDAIFDDKGHSGLLTSQMTPHWRATRRAVASSLSPQSLRSSFPKIQGVGDRLVQTLTALGPVTPVDMDLMCAKLSWDIIGLVGFDTDMGATQLSEQGEGASSGVIATVRAGMKEIEMRFVQPFRHNVWRHIFPSAREGHRNLRKVHVLVRGLLKKLRQVDPESLGNTVAGQLLRMIDASTGKPLSDDVIMPEIATMFLAGFETSGHSEAWTLYLISQHPEVEERILQELAQHELVPGPHAAGRAVRLEDLSRLTYLNCVIKEALRLYPAVPAVDRIAPRDMHVGGYFIPKGTLFWIHMYAMQRLASVHADPDAFRPERWLEPSYVYATSNAPKAALPPDASPDSSPGIAGSDSDESWEDLGRNIPAAAEPVELSLRPKRWIPFSEGPRSCVGRALADMSMTGTLATLLAQFHFRLADKMGGSEGVQRSEEVAITLAPSHGLFMHVEPRHPSTTA